MKLCKKSIIAIMMAMVFIIAGAVPVYAFSLEEDVFDAVTDLENKSVLVCVYLPDEKNNDISVVFMNPDYVKSSSKQDMSDWMEYMDALCYLDQITLNNEGRGEIRIQLNEVMEGDYTLFIGAASGAHVTRIEFPDVVDPRPLDTRMLEYAIAYADQAVTNGEVDQLIETVKAAFEKALQDAKAVLADAQSVPPAVTQDEIDEVAEALIKVIHYLDFKAADKSELIKLIKVAEIYEADEAAYTANSFAPFKEALDTARDVRDDKDLMDGSVVQEAWQNLLDTIMDLRFIPDKSKLGSLLSKARAYDLSLYTVGTAKALNEAIEQGDDIMKDDEAEQEDVNAAASKVKKAMDAMTPLSTSGSSDTNKTNGNGDGAADDSSSNSSVNGIKSDGANNPKTGDTMMPTMTLLILAGCGLALTILKKREQSL